VGAIDAAFLGKIKLPVVVALLCVKTIFVAENYCEQLFLHVRLLKLYMCSRISAVCWWNSAIDFWLVCCYFAARSQC